jgi:sulfatase maturation enzyme AslB (radical SAM superfamily)
MSFLSHLRSIEINPTELCNLQCSFCPRSFGYPNKNLHMSIETAQIIRQHLDEIGYSQNLWITGRGEPTLHNNFEELVDVFAKDNPSYNISMVTNGKWLFDKYHKVIPKFDEINYDVYDTAYDDQGNAKQRIRAKKLKASLEGQYKNLKILFKPDYGGLEWRKRDYGHNMTTRGYEDRLTNKILKDTSCNIIFERLFIDWNGDYNLCCHDWYEKIVLGNVRTESIADYVETNETLIYYKNKLVDGNRKDLTVCKNCDKSCPIQNPDYKKSLDMFNACR